MVVVVIAVVEVVGDGIVVVIVVVDVILSTNVDCEIPLVLLADTPVCAFSAPLFVENISTAFAVRIGSGFAIVVTSAPAWVPLSFIVVLMGATSAISLLCVANGGSFFNSVIVIPNIKIVLQYTLVYYAFRRS